MKIESEWDAPEEGEMAEAFFQEDKDRLFTIMTKRGLSGEIQERVLAKIIQRWDCTDRHDWLLWDVLIREEGIDPEVAEAVIVDDFIQLDFTLEDIQENWGIGMNYKP